MTALLRQLIAVPSISRDESAAADLLCAWMEEHGLQPQRVKNNLWSCCEPDGAAMRVLNVPNLPPTEIPVLLLNAHIDTVKPASGYSRDPFTPVEEGGRIYGLGSNDDGGSLVALLSCYLRLMETRQPYRLIFSATAEEEVCGRDGFEAVFPFIGHVDLAVMGEPTGMQMAVAERGLMVLDCTAKGRSGHAARNEGINAIYEALPDIEWFRTHQFEKVSPYLGPIKMTVTQINAGTQHNVVPDSCSFVVDVRPNGLYGNVELLEMIKSSVSCSVKERSTRLGSSHISMDHPVVKRGLALGLEAFGSPTTSNQAVWPHTSIKIGPGQSSRSHTADEFICTNEIGEGIEIYYKLLNQLELWQSSGTKDSQAMKG